MPFELKQIIWRLRRAAIGAGLSISSALPHFISNRTRGQAIIFTLHHVRPYTNENFAPSRLLEITPEFLDNALSIIAAAGYQPSSLKDLPSNMAAKPDTQFAVFTLDDGYRNNALYAAPIFEKHGMPFTVFVTEGFSRHKAPIWWELAERIIASQSSVKLQIGDETLELVCEHDDDKHLAFIAISDRVHQGQERNVIQALSASYEQALGDPLAPTAELIMDEEELKALIAQYPLCDLGTHTVTHPNMAFLAAEDLQREIVQSRDFVSSIVGTESRIFAYPYGLDAALSPTATEQLAKQGFQIAVTTRPGTLTQNDFIERSLVLPRVSLNGYYQTSEAVRGLLSGFPFLLVR